MRDPITLVGARALKKLSQKELCEIAGIRQRTYSCIETGVTTNPRTTTKYIIAHALDMDIADIIWP